MKNKQITLKDLAAELDLHFTTVSKALRDHPGVSPKTKKRVRKLAQEMNYFPDWNAQNLRYQDSTTIGVIVPKISNYFFASVVHGIEEVMYESHYTILVNQSNESWEREKTNLRPMLSRRVAGLLIAVSMETTDTHHLKVFEQHGIPIVFFDRYLNGIKASRIYSDDVSGAYNAVNYLINKGYRKIAHLAGPQTVSVGQDRYKGYKKALKEHDIPLDDDLIWFGGFLEEDGREGFQYLYKNGDLPDAIFAANDYIAFGVYQKAKKHNIRIPEDLAVMGYGNSDVSQMTAPPLSTVNQQGIEMGRRAANLLLEAINSEEDVFQSKEVVLRTDLIVREST
ncbi:MAG: LacI family transcriptional regulator [Candidatus Marinimicrobia bacterium]|nr:LacI family transcriptional regulator [Candidatus Neomarinimicrobiota bacterium]MCF7828298.1 LacI family transcriptional regulator [Candidatus Neomarinimicrobiota bacterium]MCF7879527.1 LacI family transcriptional regulator [Candidatus Neomarinimicrobiota bacterium]